MTLDISIRARHRLTRGAAASAVTIAALAVVSVVPWGVGTPTAEAVPPTISVDRVYYQRYSASPVTCPTGFSAHNYGCLASNNQTSTARLYSAKYDGTDEQPIDMTCTGPLAIWLAPFDGNIKIAVDAVNGKLYWENDGEPAIARSNLDGSNCEYVTHYSYYNKKSIALDDAGAYLYSIQNSTIRRIKLSDGTTDILTLTGLGITPNASYQDVTVAGDTLYATLDNVGSAGYIIAVTLDAASTSLAARSLLAAQPTGMKGISVDSTNGFVYWATGSAVKRANLADGTGVQTVQTGGYNYVVAMPAESRLLIGARGNSFAMTTDLAGNNLTTTSLKPIGFPTAGLAVVTPVAQTVTWNPSTSLTTSPVSPAAATTTGDGAISYSVVTDGGTGCTVDSTSGQLQFTTSGACTVRATAAATGLYLTATADVAFDIVVPVPTTTLPPTTLPPATLAALHISLGLGEGEPVAGAEITASGDGLQPFSDVTIELHSTPTLLGSAMTDGVGAFSTTIRLPEISPGAHRVIVTGTSSVGVRVSTEQGLVVDWSGASVAVDHGNGYTPVVPQRVLDTRTAGVAVGAGETVQIRATGAAGVPADASAVSATFTVTEPQAAGFLTVFPCGAERPLASMLNFTNGQTVANMAITGLGSDDMVCVFTSAETHLVVDVTGSFAPAGDLFTGVEPVRLGDTRTTSRVDAGQTIRLPVAGAHVSAAVINVIAVDPATPGFLTVSACGTTPPDTSNLNFSAGQTMSAQAIAPVVDGDVCIYTSSTTDLVVDLSGVFSASETSTFVQATPGRMLDTRDGQAIGGKTDIEIDLSMLPMSVTALALNVTVTNPVAAGFLTIYPCGGQMPASSNLTFAAEATIANHVTAELGVGRSVCVHASRDADVIIDVTGLYSIVTT